MNYKESLDGAVKALRAGEIILYPTDTIWGIGCDATSPEAVAKVFALKRREDSKSLVLLAADLDMVARYIAEIPPIAIDLVEVNDAPMTIIYPGADGKLLAHNTIAEDGSVGIRIPLGGFCLDLVRRFGKPIVSTSANISGEPSPAGFEDISEEICKGCGYIVEPSAEGETTGKASQIIKVGLDGSVSVIRK